MLTRRTIEISDSESLTLPLTRVTESLGSVPVWILEGIDALRPTLSLGPSHLGLVPSACAALILSLNRDLLGPKGITRAMVTGD